MLRRVHIYTVFRASRVYDDAPEITSNQALADRACEDIDFNAYENIRGDHDFSHDEDFVAAMIDEVDESGDLIGDDAIEDLTLVGGKWVSGCHSLNDRVSKLQGVARKLADVTVRQDGTFPEGTIARLIEESRALLAELNPPGPEDALRESMQTSIESSRQLAMV